MSSTAPPTHLELGGKTYMLERPTGLKASRALALMRALSKATPRIGEELAEFRRKYERENFLELDRVQARMRYPARPVTDAAGAVMIDEKGAPVMLPSPVDRMSEEDWQATGGVFRAPASPSGPEVIAAIFDTALELAEEHVYKLLALFTITNSELKTHRAAGTLAEALEDRKTELLDDAFADELLELAVACGELVDHHFRRKSAELGDRVGNALRLIGLDWTPTSPSTPTPASTDGPSSSKPSSSTATPASTPDGPPTPSSTPPTTSSSSSEHSSPETTPSESSTTSAEVAEPEPATA